jgi:hypothetical protein
MVSRDSDSVLISASAFPRSNSARVSKYASESEALKICIRGRHRRRYRVNSSAKEATAARSRYKTFAAALTLVGVIDRHGVLGKKQIQFFGKVHGNPSSFLKYRTIKSISRKMWHETCHIFVIARLRRAIAEFRPFRYSQYEVMHMDLIVRLKTGFFERTPYRLENVEKGLLLIPIKAGGGERIVINGNDILSVTLAEQRYPELEIQTRDAVYAGILGDEYLFGEAVSYFNKNLNVKITCEYNGGAYHV